MKLSEFRKVSDYYSGTASQIVRQFILAGIAIIWMFRTSTGTSGDIYLNKMLLIPLIMLCLAALFDLLQYFVGGNLWANFYKKEEGKALKVQKKRIDFELDPEVRAPRKYGRRIGWFYHTKIILLLVSYVLIIAFLINNIKLT